MDEKTLVTLEFPKILARLAEYAAFSASAELARALRPTGNLQTAQERLAVTSEARLLLSVKDDVTIGGATDIRPLVEVAARRGVLTGPELMEVKNTLIAARELYRSLERQGEQFPHLSALTASLAPPPGLVEAISRAISERGDILDSASPQLSSIRSETRVAHERLLSRLERILNDPKNAPILQENIITQRNGRYVIPLRADFKGRMRSIVHDQSSSGATLFVEPLVVVELNNRWHELQLAERDEERRILAALSDQVGENAAQLGGMVEALAQLDLALMCAKYAEDLHASEPLLLPYHGNKDGQHPGSTLRLYRARHPLLDPQSVVPIDVVLDDETFAVIITGPNTGGKTVTLKTVGLMSVMSQTGLHIPTQSGSELSLFENIYADIGDEQSIEQSLSTFSGHITNIVRILKRATSHTLVLLDELGAGTDPQEGAALARAILENILRRRVPCMIATHYPELKAFAHSTPGIINASMEFSLDTLRPTYHLTLGLPGRSNALAIAERLGLSPEIINAARTTIDPNDLRAEDLLDEIHRQRDLAQHEREAAEKTHTEAEKLKAELLQRMERIEDERRSVLSHANAELEAEAEALRTELDEVRRALQHARQPLEALKPLQEKVSAIQDQLEQPIERQRAAAGETHPLRVGDRIRLRSLGMEGILTTLGESDAEVQVGNLRIRSRLEEIQLPGVVEAPPEPAPKARGRAKEAAPKQATIFQPSPGMELDLRGQRAEDALDVLDRYLESAFLAGLPYVRIIHGKGTGKLREVVRDALKASPHVKHFEGGQDKEGGEGVTVAHLDVD